MKARKTNRVLAILLMLALTVSLLPVSVFAENAIPKDRTEQRAGSEETAQPVAKKPLAEPPAEEPAEEEPEEVEPAAEEPEVVEPAAEEPAAEEPAAEEPAAEEPVEEMSVTEIKDVPGIIITEVEIPLTEPIIGELPQIDYQAEPPLRLNSDDPPVWKVLDPDTGALTPMSPGQRFMPDTTYFIVVPLYAVEGAVFADNAVVTLGGSTQFDMMVGTADYIIVGRKFTTAHMDVISAVDISCEVPKAGAAPKVPTVNTPNVLLNNGGTPVWLEIDSVDATGQPRGIKPNPTVFTAGKMYMLQVTVVPGEGGIFAEGADKKFTMNGTIPADAKTSYSLFNMSVTWTFTVPELTEIDKVEVAVTAPKAGELPAAPVVETENVVLKGYSWVEVDPANDNKLIRQLADGDKFEAGKTYGIGWGAQPAEGYVFSEELVVTVNGKDDFFYIYCEATSINAGTMFTVPAEPTVIDKLEVTIAVPKAGELPAAPVVKTENVVLQGYSWVEVDPANDNKFIRRLEDGDKFEAGKAYGIGWGAQPAEGYVFSEELVVTVNGKDDFFYIYCEATSVNAGNVFTVPAGPAVIDKLEATVTEPKAGELPAAPVIKTENATLEVYYWYEVELRPGDTPTQVKELQDGDKFEAGKSYVLIWSAHPAEGYEFSDELEATLNGKSEFFIANYGTTGFSAGAVFTVPEATVTPPKGGTPAAAAPAVNSPKTSDEGNPVLLVVLMTVSALGMVTLTVYRKKKVAHGR